MIAEWLLGGWYSFLSYFLGKRSEGKLLKYQNFEGNPIFIVPVLALRATYEKISITALTPTNLDMGVVPGHPLVRGFSDY